VPVVDLESSSSPVDYFSGQNAITVDVEDYFQVSAFSPYVDQTEWSGYEIRVEQNMDRILELFDHSGVTGTFFFLGWVAEKFPSLLRRVAGQGHEIASHGYAHVQVCDQDEDSFRQDADRTKRMLEDIAGVPVWGYRAASFSIGVKCPWAYDVLAETGHKYSSSINPIRHDRYSAREAPRFIHINGSSGIPELPVATVEFSGMRFPCGGGGFFRLLPYAWSKWCIHRINMADRQPAIFYFHPWEIDDDQPRISGLDTPTKFRHYVNLKRMEKKLALLLRDFRWTTIKNAFEDVI
jgi:polysaccharide deacetylase family protein (PEP-CTERM system associated)